MAAAAIPRGAVLAVVLALIGAVESGFASTDRAQAPDPDGLVRANVPVHSDFNGDGFADIAIGAPFESVRDASKAGAVHVLYGSGDGPQADAPDDQLWTQNSAGVKEDAEEFDQFGSALDAADFNADGFSDLAVGVRAEDVGAAPNAGAVNVLYGSGQGLQADEPDDQLWTQDSPGVKDAPDGYDQFGIPLGAGDFNSDGFPDLAVGVPDEGVPGAHGSGAVNVLYGSPEGLQASLPDDQFWTQDSPGVKDLAEAIDGFGWSFGIGDYNADGFVDLAIGVANEDLADVEAAGAVNVLYGSAGGLQADSPDDQFWSQDSPEVQEDLGSLDHFGSALAAGDFNDDGFADLAIGVRLEDLGVLEDAGAVNVLYGSPGGLQAVFPDDQLWTQDSPDVEDDAEGGDRYGRSLATGDFNLDGFVDLAVAVEHEDVAGAIGAGAVSILFGAASGLQALFPDDQLLTQDTPDVRDAAEEGDEFGSSLAAEDFNADGFLDLGIGVQHEDIGEVEAAGAASVLYGSAGGLQATSPDDQFWHQASPGVKDTPEDDDEFGSSLSE